MRKYIEKNKWLVLAYLIMSLISSGMTVYLSIILRDIIDVAIGLELDGFYNLLITSAIFFIVLGVVLYITEVLYTLFITRVIRNVREDVFGGIMKQDVGQFESVNSADYISALTNDINLVEDNYFSSLAEVAEMVMLIIIAIGFMIYLSFIVAACLLATLIILISAQALFTAPIRKRQTRLSKSLSAFTIKIKDIFSGFEVIKSYQMNDHIKESFKKRNDEVIKSNFSLYHFSTITGSIAAVIGLFLQVGVVFFSAYLIIQGYLTPGDMIGMLVISGQITGPVEELGQTIPMITGSREIVKRLEGFVGKESGYKGSKLATFNNSIRVEKLEFTYPEQKDFALKGVDFTFLKNKKYALIGKSGCGKTTLAKVLIGHLDNYRGNVLYDEIELKELTVESFGKLPSMVHQFVYMFDEDIEQNICLYKEYSREELRAAILASGVSLFLGGERTLQTKVGENGANLSGGQRQRIAVARALIQNKPLLILDEGTSAVDTQTGLDIENRLLAREDLTLITITHSLRDEMLRQYDEIIYIEEGRIVENGAYVDLLDLGGRFSKYMFPTSNRKQQSEHFEDLDEDLSQYKPLNYALEEINQGMKELGEKFSQYIFQNPVFDDQGESPKDLGGKSNHYNIPIENFNQYIFHSAVDELGKSSTDLDGKLNQHMIKNSALDKLGKGSKDLDIKFDQHLLQSSALNQLGRSSEDLVSWVKSLYFF